MKTCPCCGFAPPTKYKYHVDDLNVSALLKLWHYAIETGVNKINVKDVDFTQGERLRMTQLRFHALVAKVKENGKQLPNMWLITKRGADFLHGRKVVPAHVYTQANKVIDHAKTYVSRADFKILSNFGSTFEIVDDKLVTAMPTQNQLL